MKHDLHVHAIAAVGMRGQIGLKSGGIPWLKGKRPEWSALDLKIFRAATNGAALISGSKTYDEIDGLSHVQTNLHFRYDPVMNTLDKIKETVRNMRPDIQDLWVLGGAKTFDLLKDQINGIVLISNVPYDCDVSEDVNHVFLPKDLLRRSVQSVNVSSTSREMIIKRWISIQEPGCTPEKKRPIEQTHEGTLRMAAEALLNRAKGTKVQILNLTWDYDMQIDCAQEALYENAVMFDPKVSSEWKDLWNKVAAYIDATPLK